MSNGISSGATHGSHLPEGAVGTNWSQLAKHDQDRLDVLAHEVAHFATMANTSKVFAGKALNEARAIFGDNQAFGAWREDVLPGLHRKEALRYMQVAEEYGDRPNIVEALSFHALRTLSAPSTPQEVRQHVEAIVERGEDVTAAQIERLKRDVEEAERRADRAELDAKKHANRADTLVDGQEALVAKARGDARREVEQELEEARRAEADAKQRLALETDRLTRAVSAAKGAAIEQAKAEARSFAEDAINAAKHDLNSAKKEEAAARQAVERLRASEERLTARVAEHEGYLRSLKNADIEAKALRKEFEDVNRALTIALTGVADIEHEHGEEVIGKARRTAAMCRQFADAIEAIQPAQAEPLQMKVISND